MKPEPLTEKKIYCRFCLRGDCDKTMHHPVATKQDILSAVAWLKSEVIREMREDGCYTGAVVCGLIQEAFQIGKEEQEDADTNP